MPVLSIQQFGVEREPVVVIDGFSEVADELEKLGRAALYHPAGLYPGVRSPFDPAYLRPMAPMLSEIFHRAFGLTGANVERCDFSMISVQPDDLSAAQRIPHYDDTGPEVLALLHYLGDEDSGGTAFFRHCRTGFETMTPERLAEYAAGLQKDDAEFPPTSGYFTGDNQRFEMIGSIASRRDRAIIYRGRTLHYGLIRGVPDAAELASKGRLTINTFLVGYR